MQKFIFIFSALVLGFSAETFAAKKTIHGEILIGIEEDFKTGKFKERYYVKEQKTQRVTELFFRKKSSKELVQGDLIEVSGEDYGNAFAVDSATITAAPVSAYDYVTGFTADKPKTILIILVKMAGGTGGLSASGVDQAMYASSNSVRDMWSKNTWGRMHISGDADGDGRNDILGPVTIDSSVTESCSASTWGSEAKAAVQLQYGTDLSKYTDFIFVLPDNVTCNWQGYNLGSHSYLHDSTTRAATVLAHELGHSWGLHHASVDSNNDTTVDSEYGDYSCLMSNAQSLRFLNAPHAFKVGTLSHAANSAVTVTENSTLEVYPLEENPLTAAGPQIVRIQRGTNDYLYLSFRSGQNYLTNSSGSTLTVHSAGERPYRSLLLANISAGQTWTDQLSGAVISVNSLTNSKVSVSVTVPALACAPSTPLISVYQSSATNSSSGSKQISYIIRNRDNLSCAGTTFQLASSSSPNITVSLPASSVYLKPGQSVTQTLTVNYSNLAEGKNLFYISASDNDGSLPEHSTATSSGAIELDTIAPSVPLDLIYVSGRKGLVNLSWQASVDGLNSAISYIIYRDTGAGFVEIGQTSALNFSDVSSVPAKYSVAAKDSAGNISVQSNIVAPAVRTGGRKR